MKILVVVLGSGNVKPLKTLPASCRAGDNASAFTEGFRLWGHAEGRAPRAQRTPDKSTTEQKGSPPWKQ
jgi:hypothetical protein